MTVADRWDPTNGKTGHLTHKFRIGHFDGFSQPLPDGLFIDTIRTTGNDQNGLVGLFTFKNKRFYDLPYFTADCPGGIFCASRGVLHLDDFTGQAIALQCFLNALSAGFQLFTHFSSFCCLGL